jgi:hypothetical protein
VERGLLAAGSPPGWLALAAAGPAAIRPLGIRLRSARPPGAAAGGLGLGVLAAGTAARWDRGEWLAYHVLLALWTLTGLVVLARGRLALRRPIVSDTPLAEAGGVRRRWMLAGAVGPLAALVLALAVRGAVENPEGMAWWMGAVLIVAVQAALVAVWLRSETWAFVATACLDLAVSLLIWDVFYGKTIDLWWIELLQANEPGVVVVRRRHCAGRAHHRAVRRFREAPRRGAAPAGEAPRVGVIALLFPTSPGNPGRPCRRKGSPGRRWAGLGPCRFPQAQRSLY